MTYVNIYEHAVNNAISIKNTEKVEKMLKEAQVNAKVRTLTISDIDKYINIIEKKLSTILYKKDWNDLIFSIQPCAQKKANSYKWAMESTSFILIRKSNSWKVFISRGSTGINAIEITNLYIKKDELLKFLSSSHKWD